MVNSKQKGNRGERELVNLFKEIGLWAERSQQYCGRSGDAADVICRETPNIHWESKFTERLNLYGALDQAESDAKSGRIPVVAHRKTRKNWVAILDLKQFLEILKRGGYIIEPQTPNPLSVRPGSDTDNSPG